MKTSISTRWWNIWGVVLVLLCELTRGQKNIDNNKPVFSQCKTYAPSVLEEQPTGTFVINVTAYDPNNDIIEYSLVNAPGEKPKFRINPISGQITTERVFDRDEPSREKEVYITVRATDNGRPVLDDVCTFKVTIVDINDNPPVFDKTRYDELMSEDTKPGTVFMRISASDLDDGKNSVIVYTIKDGPDSSFFEIDRDTGRIKLRQTVDRRMKSMYHINVEASNPDHTMPQSQIIVVNIQIIESNKKPPKITDIQPDTVIHLPENFSDFTAPIISFTAISNVENQPEVVFELVPGRTEQTNMRKAFIANQTGNTATILLGSRLDYEVNPEYTLTMQVRNTYDLVEERIVRIFLEDVNDNIPFFTDVTSGTISENEPPGTPVMQVRGFDNDGTIKNNIVSFRLDDESREYFQIDSETGNITSLVSFDREARDFYNVKIIATDNSPSALYNTGEPNKGQQVFRIQIADKNDHSPKFTQSEYIADKLPEDANVNSPVIEVQAIDIDTASQIVYEIISGNIGNAFLIEEKTGRIKINKPLDYETLTEYKLQIRASDGLYNDSATVIIKLEDVNDNPPIMMPLNATVQIDEETIPEGCIVKIDAYDPDIKDRNVDQRIVYEIVDEQKKKLFTVDNGCLKLISPLDRDKPFGFKSWQIFVAAIDDNGNGLKTSGEYTIELNDINDNAPFLTTTSIVWMENSRPNKIIEFKAKDYDEPINGEPFKFEIDGDADYDIQDKFEVTGNMLYAKVSFDREEQKIYKIPVRISDNGYPTQSNISYFTVIIGDVNDNKMQEGESNIFIYNYKGEAPDTQIGRVYVNDPDDWDLPDKKFEWYNQAHESFAVDNDSGMITMKRGTQGGNHTLSFEVFEETDLFGRHSVIAIVHVEVKIIPEEAVHNSGSVRFYGITAEDFIAIPLADEETGMIRLSYKDRFRNIIARKFNISEMNVDVFTVLHKSDNSSFLDVRFTAHNSPYYDEIKLNSMISQNQAEIERELGIQMYMINIDECIIERAKCESSCYNEFYATSVPIQVYTNTTSFVGVNAFVQAECLCYAPPTMVCYNGGTQVDETCECIEGFEGPHCELTSIGFYGNGYAHYKPTNPCDSTNISIVIEPRSPNGLILYMGPMAYNSLLRVQDFLAFEMINSYPVVTVDYGTGSSRIFYNYTKFELNQRHQVDIILQKSSIEMVVNNCRLSKCLAFAEPVGDNEYLNVNQPLQLGGSSVDLEAISASYRWSHTPQKQGFNGCVKRLAIGDKVYNLGDTTVAVNADSGCHRTLAATVSFGIDTNFLIAILVCLALLIILLLAVVVTKKRQDGWHEKDMDDIRETIINYEDEGGGERDADYDLDVLRAPPIYEDQPRYGMRKLQQQHEPNEVPDIGGFLVDKKDTCDRDNDAHPFDDMRHYAYEGDGNSTGSLSSLASCTDDGDLKFDYLSNFGPRFRKLADMYGEEPSDTDSNVDGEEGWRI